MSKKENPSASAQKNPDPALVQQQASDPLASVWVTASAGTGKTKVLTDRVLRLMLDGARPDQVLCLTFTRAAAGEMKLRVRQELSLWASLDDAALKKRLQKLTGLKPDAEKLHKARTLFSAFIDAHGGLRIQTIHSFSESLIRRFPVESGIPPYFSVMDDQSAADMLRESQAEVLQQVQKEPGTPLARAVHMVTPEVSEDDFISLINELTYRRGQLLGIFERKGGLEPTIDAVYAYMQAPRGLDSRTMNERFNADQGLDGRAPDLAGLDRAASILLTGSPAEQEKAKMIKAWLLSPEQRSEIFWDYAAVFLTKEGEIRKKLTTKATAAAEEVLREEASRLSDGIEIISAMNVARGTESLLRMADAILKTYENKKRANNLLDYDDLIHRADKMMQPDGAAGWVLQKLPGDLRHILIDEAQDTNPDQWQLVSAIAREFFTGAAMKKDPSRTIFAVGDEKQSIFSFQRADPKEFNRRRKFFADLVERAGGAWREVEMDVAFRSSPAITSAVDAVFAESDAADGLFFKDGDEGKKVHHNPYRKGQAGLVEIHPVLRPAPQEDVAPWALPLEMEGAANPGADLADKIADQIKEWLDSGEKLPSRNRPVSPADIMILVRRRSAFVDDMVRALKKRDVPVAGADRLSLREQIVVMDLMALGEVLLFPRDDYKLACVLKSPLVGMTDQQLEDLAAGRTATLWEALTDKAKDKNAAPVYAAALDYFTRLQKDLNTERPYEFYSSVLMDACPANDKSGLAALLARLGFEAEDPLVEFMNAIESFEKIHPPTLQGFLAWLDAGEAEVKREVSLNPETPRVHIMTVHGAKGLEAPIVILPDTTGIPADNSRARPKFLWPETAAQGSDADRDIPLWVPRADLESRVFTREREQAERERDREYRRLLYVAMTRAADRLYVYGYQNAKSTPEDSWYALIRRGVEKNLNGKFVMIEPAPEAPKERSALPLAVDKPVPGETPAIPAAADKPETKKPEEKKINPEQMILRFVAEQTAKPEPDGVKPLKKSKASIIPDWARAAPPAGQKALGRFTPSEHRQTGEDVGAPSPLDTKGEGYWRQLGTIVHDLFEFLPALPAGEREAAAKNYLARPVWNLPADEQKQTLGNIMNVLNDKAFTALFGENSRAEVSIAGIVEHGGEKKMLSGQIDRLVVEDKAVTIVDFKNSLRVPKDAAGVQTEYVVQMAAYRMIMQQIYPDKEIKCALLYTRSATMITLPPQAMDAALKKIDVKVHTAGKKPAGPKGA